MQAGLKQKLNSGLEHAKQNLQREAGSLTFTVLMKIFDAGYPTISRLYIYITYWCRRSLRRFM